MDAEDAGAEIQRGLQTIGHTPEGTGNLLKNAFLRFYLLQDMRRRIINGGS
jgi:hypothetical protein